MGMLARRLPKFRWFESRPKTAWCCRWVLGSVAVLAVAAWVFTLWWQVVWCVPTFGIAQLVEGKVCLQSDPVTDRFSDVEDKGVHVRGRYEFSLVYRRLVLGRDDVARSPSGESPLRGMFPWPSLDVGEVFPLERLVASMSVPLWLVLLLTAPPALAAWRSRWIANREGKCSKCGYSRTGLAGGVAAVCPECGTAPTADIAKS